MTESELLDGAWLVVVPFPEVLAVMDTARNGDEGPRAAEPDGARDADIGW